MSSGKNFFSEAKALFELPFSSAAAIPLPPPSLYLQLVPVKDRELFRAYIFYLFCCCGGECAGEACIRKALISCIVPSAVPGPDGRCWDFCKRNLSPAIFPCRCCWNRWTVLNGCLKTVYPLEFSAASPICFR